MVKRKWQKIVHQTLHRILNIEHDPTINNGVDSGALEWQTVHDPPVEPVAFLSNDMNII
jgi:hypothetical protein